MSVYEKVIFFLAHRECKSRKAVPKNVYLLSDPAKASVILQRPKLSRGRAEEGVALWRCRNGTVVHFTILVTGEEVPVDPSQRP